jgi:hypothetical protein
MAEFSFTISERMNVFGGAPTSKWAAYNWNAFKWGEGTAQLELGLFLATHESQSSLEALSVQPTMGISETISAAESLPSLSVRDMAGYYHVFPDRTTEVTGLDLPTWTSGAASAASWVSVALNAPSWS